MPLYISLRGFGRKRLCSRIAVQLRFFGNVARRVLLAPYRGFIILVLLVRSSEVDLKCAVIACYNSSCRIAISRLPASCLR